jgi:hypothetical protein
MGVLTSKLFTIPPQSSADRLELCAVDDPSHVIPGSAGDHVKRIQIALNQLSNVFLVIDGAYGPKTAAAAVAFKEAQVPPLRRPGQSIADNIVGIRTIIALDKQMVKLETPAPVAGFISLTPFGSPHDHGKDTRCLPFLDSDNFEGRISHHGTPVNPQGFGRKVAIGGTNEVKYLGFENFMPDPKDDPDLIPSQVQGRPLTGSIRDHSCSDICFRSSPIDRSFRAELKRIAAPGCRLTYANNAPIVAREMPFLRSLGPLIQSAVVSKGNPFDPDGLSVVVISMLNLR